VWTARNEADRRLLRGERCVVIRVDRLTIFLEPEGVRA
jgi:hypothetical protein